ncbi:MAG: MOSC N-terminal beta barrel domain-containing protein [Acidimicrobiales bacterium]
MAALDGVEVGTVAACWRHPVKSFQGFRVEAIEVDPRGVDLDRAWGSWTWRRAAC